MKERPILFYAPMVRAILDGSKTQTRRAFSDPMVKTMGYAADAGEVSRFIEQGFMHPNDESYVLDFCPYGQPGDRLWVRETFSDLWGTGIEYCDANGKRQRYAFAADCQPGSYADQARKDYGISWKPSIHMPRWASRILLEIVSVRVERLQDISEEDANAEGVELERCCNVSSNSCGTHIGGCCGQPKTIEPIDAYRELWNSINGADAWDVNPWVWVVEFKRVEA